jgi:hypothetical protein
MHTLLTDFPYSHVSEKSLDLDLISL